jgi:hypothetical protein
MVLACVITQAGYNAEFETGNLIPKRRNFELSASLYAKTDLKSITNYKKVNICAQAMALVPTPCGGIWSLGFFLVGNAHPAIWDLLPEQ